MVLLTENRLSKVKQLAHGANTLEALAPEPTLSATAIFPKIRQMAKYHS